jgi:flagellar M-ring protein FliF
MMETLRKLGPVKLGALGGIALLLLAFFAYIGVRMSTPDMALLYGDLDPADSSHIVEKLDQMGVPYQIGADGTSIRVPANQALKLRMNMAQAGLPGGGSIGYEIFDQQQPLGTTSFEQQVNKLRAMEGELARTIKTIDLVKNVRVHLVIPERQLFAKEQPTPSASIILTMAGGAVLDKQQVSAIEHLVAAAVPGLKPNAVSIVDSTGTLLAAGSGDSDDSQLSGSSEEMRLGYENKIRRSIEELLQRTLGYGKIRAEVTADLDFDRVTTNSETFNPDGQVVRSTQTVEEKNNSSDAQPSDQVTVANNLPNPAGGGGGSASTSASSSQRTEETVNYEISKETQVHIRETGQIKKLSVAVLVDGTYATAPDGTNAYTPRSAQELDQISKLVKSAIGYDEKRGDTVEVVNMRFADNTEIGSDANAGLIMGFSRADLVRIIEMLVLALLGALAIMFGLRPLLNRLLSPAKAGAVGQITDQTAGQMALPSPDGSTAMAPGPNIGDEIERMIDIGQIEGQVRASSIKKISELVAKHPEEAVGIMRGWMYQDS